MTEPTATIEGWFRQYAGVLVLYARQWLDADAAADVVQEVFTRLLSQGRSPADIQPWLYRTARYMVLNRHRQRRRRENRESRAARACAEEPAGREDDRIDAETVQQALERLPIEQREAIVLRIWGQMSLAEIGEVTGAPVSTVFNRYRLGLAAVRRHFKLDSRLDSSGCPGQGNCEA